MPLILLSGYPLSGKTHRSKQLIAHFEKSISESSDRRASKLKVVHISDDTLGVSRNAYENARDEKNARAAFSSAIKRHLDHDTIVVADGMNYIKGFRYQMYCDAKEVSTTNCVIHVGTPPSLCRERNEKRIAAESSTLTSTIPDAHVQDHSYPVAVFDNLIQRYEEPNGMTRWDSPLFTIIDEDLLPPLQGITDALVPWLTPKSTSVSSAPVRPHQATVLKPASQADFLQLLDRATNAVLDRVTEWLRDNADQGTKSGLIYIDDVETPLDLPLEMPAGNGSGPVTRAVLLRLKRHFVVLNRETPFGKTVQSVKSAFVDYLNDAMSD